MRGVRQSGSRFSGMHDKGSAETTEFTPLIWFVAFLSGILTAASAGSHGLAFRAAERSQRGRTSAATAVCSFSCANACAEQIAKLRCLTLSPSVIGHGRAMVTGKDRLPAVYMTTKPAFSVATNKMPSQQDIPKEMRAARVNQKGQYVDTA